MTPDPDNRGITPSPGTRVAGLGMAVYNTPKPRGLCGSNFEGSAATIVYSESEYTIKNIYKKENVLISFLHLFCLFFL